LCSIPTPTYGRTGTYDAQKETWSNAIGISNLVIGIVTILVGVGAGVTMIVNGARLITGKKDITF
jgi:hypothetical protein